MQRAAHTAAGLLYRAMKLKEEAPVKFARNDGDSVVARTMREADEASKAAFARLAEAHKNAIKQAQQAANLLA